MAVSDSVAGAGAAVDVRAIVRALADARVRYVLTGSLAAAAWAGPPPAPIGDFDLAPDLAPDNLARLAALLAACGARPVHRPDWKRGLDLEAIARWRPEPATPEQLDHQLVTPWGLLDVVPTLSGAFEALALRAVPSRGWGITVSIAHPEDLRATLRPDREAKHRAREAAIDAAVARAAAGGRPHPLDVLYPGDR
jgi:hypothetical protein